MSRGFFDNMLQKPEQKQIFDENSFQLNVVGNVEKAEPLKLELLF
jgi:hypothetical protein